MEGEAGFTAWPRRRSFWPLSATALASWKILSPAPWHIPHTLATSAPPRFPIARAWKSLPPLLQFLLAVPAQTTARGICSETLLVFALFKSFCLLTQVS